jgi:YD repeat-containing protein
MINAHRVETTLTQDRTLTLEDLPFQAGDAVEVIVLGRAASNSDADDEPEETDWDALDRIIEENRMDTGIGDLAHQHDHYLYGTPKRE